MNSDFKFQAFAIAGFLIFIAGIGIFRAKMESDTYNRLTGAKTTLWDAVWLELRVVDAPAKWGNP